MRGKESRYLRPLVLKMGDMLDHGIPQTLMPPPHTAPVYVQSDVRPMGHVYDEDTTTSMQRWTQNQQQPQHPSLQHVHKESMMRM